MQRSFWLKFSVFNFVLVAFLGVIMRYKILYSLPFIDQKNLQEAHSHFAFYGWIANALYALLVLYLSKVKPELPLKKYQYILLANMVSSFGMLFSFMYGSYYWASIAASTAAVLSNFVFSAVFFRDALKIKETSKIWFLTALFFAVISAAGVFNIGYMKATGTATRDIFLASEYFYLHFQYNGFFIFSCIGLLLFAMKEAGAAISEKENRWIYWLMAVGCLVGYGLSVLWMKMDILIFGAIVLATVGQTVGAVLLFRFVKRNWAALASGWSKMQRFVLLFSGFAFGVKILLQLGSNIPALSQFAFGFRNVVIAYLHLVLLMCIATFLINQILATNFFKVTKTLALALKGLLLGIFLNEAILGVMGILSIKYISVPYANHALLCASLLMFISLVILYFNMKKADNITV